MGNRHLETARSIFPVGAPYLHLIRRDEGIYAPVPGLTNPELTTGMIYQRPKVGWDFFSDGTEQFVLPLVPPSVSLGAGAGFPVEISDINAHTTGVIEANRERLERFLQTRASVSNAVRISLGNKYGLAPIEQLQFFLAQLNMTTDVVPLLSRKRIQNYGLILR